MENSQASKPSRKHNKVKGYTRVLPAQLSATPSRKLEVGYNSLKIPDVRSLKRSVQGSNSQIKVLPKSPAKLPASIGHDTVDVKEEPLATAVEDVQEEKPVVLLPTTTDNIDDKDYTLPKIVEVKSHYSLMVSDEKTSLKESSDYQDTTTSNTASKQETSADKTMHDSSQTVVADNASKPQDTKKKLLFDRTKLSSAFLKLKNGPADKENPNRNVAKFSPGSASPSDVDQELIPPSSAKPLEFEIPDTVKMKRKKAKKKKHRHHSGDLITDTEKKSRHESHPMSGSSSLDAPSHDKVMDCRPSPLTSLEQLTNRRGSTESASSIPPTKAHHTKVKGDVQILGDSVPVDDKQNEGVKKSPVVISANKTEHNSVTAVKGSCAEVKGVKRTARKTIHKNRFADKELELVRKYKSEELKVNDRTSVVVLDSIDRNTAVILNTLTRSAPKDHIPATKSNTEHMSSPVVKNFPKQSTESSVDKTSGTERSTDSLSCQIVENVPMQPTELNINETEALKSNADSPSYQIVKNVRMQLTEFNINKEPAAKNNTDIQPCQIAESVSKQCTESHSRKITKQPVTSLTNAVTSSVATARSLVGSIATARSLVGSVATARSLVGSVATARPLVGAVDSLKSASAIPDVESRKRPFGGNSPSVENKVMRLNSLEESTGMNAAFESTDLDDMLKAAGFNDFEPSQVKTESGDNLKPVSSDGPCDNVLAKDHGEKRRRESDKATSNEMESLSSATETEDDDQSNTVTKPALTVRAEDNSPAVKTAPDVDLTHVKPVDNAMVEKTDGAIAITNVRSVADPLIEDGPIDIDDENYITHSKTKLAGIYKFSNGSRIATIYKDKKLYCAAHELVIWLKISLGGLTQIRCSDKESALLRMLRRGSLKENFEFKVVPLSQVLDRLASQTAKSPLANKHPDARPRQNRPAALSPEAIARAVSSKVGSGVTSKNDSCLTSPSKVAVCDTDRSAVETSTSSSTISNSSVVKVYNPCAVLDCKASQHTVEKVLPINSVRAVCSSENIPMHRAERFSIESIHHQVLTGYGKVVDIWPPNTQTEINKATPSSDIPSSSQIVQHSGRLATDRESVSKDKESPVTNSASNRNSGDTCDKIGSPDVVFIGESFSQPVTNQTLQESSPSVSSKNSSNGELNVMDCYQDLIRSGDQTVVKSLEGMRPVLNVRVLHKKKILQQMVTYNGELMPNYSRFKTKTPFIIKCLGCASFFSPLNFMMHLEELDRNKQVSTGDLWTQSILLDPRFSVSLDHKSVGFWNLFVDWFQIMSGRVSENLKKRNVHQAAAANVHTISPSNAFALSSSSPIQQTTKSQDTSSDLSKFDEIPASPAPYSRPAEDVVRQKAPLSKQPSGNRTALQAATSLSQFQQTHTQRQAPATQLQRSQVQPSQARASQAQQFQVQRHSGQLPPSQQVLQQMHASHLPLYSQTQAAHAEQYNQALSQQPQSMMMNKSLPGYAYNNTYQGGQQLSRKDSNSPSRNLIPSHHGQSRASQQLMAPPDNISPMNNMMTTFRIQPTSNQLPLKGILLAITPKPKDKSVESYQRAQYYSSNQLSPSGGLYLSDQTNASHKSSNPQAAHNLMYQSNSSAVTSATSPNTTVSSSGSITSSTYVESFNKAMVQQRTSMLNIEGTFRSLEQENTSIRSQLSTERREKQEYAIKLQKALAESQSKDLQIQALQEELARQLNR